MHILFAAMLIAQSYFGGLPVDGIHCDATEGVVEHVHAHLQLFDRGRPVAVPAQVGIPQTGACLYWLHTHADDGIIHIESPVKRAFTLGQFFDLWGMSLSWQHAASLRAPKGKRLFITVDGHAWHGANPRSIVLQDHQEIVIQNGPPFGHPRPGVFM